MKTKITTFIIALILSLSAQSQIVTFYNVTPYELCPGDTLYVHFRWNHTYSPNVQFNISPSPGGIGAQIVSCNTNDFYYLPKTLVGSDTVYLLKIKTHYAIAVGPAGLSTDWVNQTMIRFRSCGRGGAGGRAVYRDMNGREIEKRYGEIISEQVEGDKPRLRVFLPMD